MKHVPKTKQEEKRDIWFEEALHVAVRSYVQDQREFIVLSKESLRLLIRDIIDDVMPLAV